MNRPVFAGLDPEDGPAQVAGCFAELAEGTVEGDGVGFDVCVHRLFAQIRGIWRVWKLYDLTRPAGNPRYRGNSNAAQQWRHR